MADDKQHILIVDDEDDLCEILKYNLQTDGYTVTTANSAEEALTMPLFTYDLFLLDVMMGEMSGFELAKKIKNKTDTAHIPIIFLTAKDTENDKVDGLELGADDYISKPFSIREVKARIKAVLRRTTPTTETLAYEGLVLDTNRKTVTVNGKEVPFTRTEFDLLQLLMEERGKVLSRQELIDKVWPKDVLVLDRTVDVNITRLRKKIEPYANRIVTRLRYGYYFDA